MGLSDSKIDFYKVEFAELHPKLEDFLELLSKKELDKASKFKYPELSESYLLGRGFLRNVLGNKLSISPENVIISEGEHGKPYVEGEISFNASHTSEYYALAVTVGGDIGLDIELIDPEVEIERVARSHFSDVENAEFGSYRKEEKLNAFFRCWTRKEAFIKSLGIGLGYPLKSFSVELGLKDYPVILESKQNDEMTWQLHNLNVAGNHAGAIAYQGERRKINYFEILTN